MTSVALIIPAHNEEKEIAATLQEVTAFANGKNIMVIVVDDGSTDHTYEIAQSFHVTCIQHIINLGKGAAVRTGCEYALSQKVQQLIIMDADGQHAVSDISHFLEKLRKNDIVFGIRALDTHSMPYRKKLGNFVIRESMYALFGIYLQDNTCGYRALTADTYRKLNLTSSDYTIENEMNVKTGILHLRYDTITIKTIYKDEYKGTDIFDGVKLVMNLFYLKLKELIGMR